MVKRYTVDVMGPVGNAHLNSEVGSICTADLLVLTGLESAASLHETICFQFQTNLVLTSKNEKVNHTDSPP